MDPFDREQELFREHRSHSDNQIASLRFELTENSDKAAFAAMVATNPVAKRLQKDVEDYLTRLRSTGANAPRETVLKYLIGERALENRSGSRTQRQRQADDNKRRQQGKPGGGQSDQAGSNRDRGKSEKDARYDRLKDMEI